jgi:hypothetical protein
LRVCCIKLPEKAIYYGPVNGSFGDVTTGIKHIKAFVADQILIGRCFEGFEWSWYFGGQTEYSFECKMISRCLDKNIVWPLL